MECRRLDGGVVWNLVHTPMYVERDFTTFVDCCDGRNRKVILDSNLHAQ